MDVALWEAARAITSVDRWKLIADRLNVDFNLSGEENELGRKGAKARFRFLRRRNRRKGLSEDTPPQSTPPTTKAASRRTGPRSSGDGEGPAKSAAARSGDKRKVGCW